MRLEDYERKVFEEFLGLYKNGEDDQVPQNYFSDCFNIDYNVGEWKTRDGLSTSITLGYGTGDGKVARFVSFADPIIGPLVLILDGVGNLYTKSIRTGDDATTPRITVAAATDFSAIKFLGKIYIGFHNGEFGLAGESLKVFIPHPTNPALDEFRNAAGLAPVLASGYMAAVNGAAGIINAGDYKIAVAYETTSGFITPPGPQVPAFGFAPTSYTSPGSVKINLSLIPTGPAGTAKRRILVTQAGLEEYFFLGSTFGGIINDNTTTTAVLDFDDTTDLVESADYLFDLLTVIPAPLGLQDYGGKLCLYGASDSISIIRVSRVGDGESFDAIDGIVIVNKDDGFSLRNAIVIRDVFYACKNLGIFSVRDNGDVPSTWPVSPIDKSINTGVHGIGEFFDISGINMARDWTLIADRSGILMFDGIARKPPITDNINDVWQLMNWAYYHKLVIAIDEQFHKVYCAFPTGSATSNNKVIMGDYNGCPGKIPEYSTIKWSPWEFKPGGTTKSPSDLGLFGYPPDKYPTLKMGSIDGGGRIWRLDPDSTDDGVVSIVGGGPNDFSDNFNRANGKAHVGDTHWSSDSFDIQLFDILSNQIKITGNSAVRPLSYRTGLSAIADQYSELAFVSVTSNYNGGVCVRDAGSAFPFSRGYCLILDSNHGVTKGITIYRYFQNVGDYNISVVLNIILSNAIIPGDRLQLRVVGTTLSAVVNDIVVGTATDSNYATGFAGMMAGAITPGSSIWDNWRGGVYPLSITPSVLGEIESYFETSLLFWEPGYVHLFAAARLRIIGAGTLLCTIRGEDNVLPTNIPSITLATAPGREFLIRFDFQNEKAKAKFRLTAGKFTVSKLEIFGKPTYSMRPA